jgi:glutaminase
MNGHRNTTLDWQDILDEVAGERDCSRGGTVARYIPPLAEVDPNLFGAALATVDGRTFVTGAAGTPFSIQSISKVFALILAVHAVGEAVWDRVRREPSGTRFDSLEQLGADHGVPRNPFLNAGAMVMTDILIDASGSPAERIVEFLRIESGDARVSVDETVAAAEVEHGHRNAAIASFMKGYGTITNPVSTVTTEYFRQCAIRASCQDLSAAALVLARRGRCRSGDPFLSPLQTRHINAVIMTCGTYDAAGDIASRVGLPCKSGVGGGVIAIIPDAGVLTVWSPPIDHQGNSVAGVEFLERFTARAGCSLF